MQGVKHHVQLAGGLLDPGDVVPPDEGIRDCGERSTTSALPKARWARRRLPSDTLLSNHRFFTQKTAQYGKILSHTTGRRKPCPDSVGPSVPEGLRLSRRAFSSPEGLQFPEGFTGPRRAPAFPEGPQSPKGSLAPEGPPVPRRATSSPEGSKKARPQPKKRGTHYAVERRAKVPSL